MSKFLISIKIFLNSFRNVFDIIKLVYKPIENGILIRNEAIFKRKLSNNTEWPIINATELRIEYLHYGSSKGAGFFYQ